MHPILFQLGPYLLGGLELGPLILRTYGLMMALGFGFGIILSLFLSRKEGRSDEVVLDLSVWIMLGSIIGARIFYVLVMPDAYRDHPLDVFAVWQGGLVYYGGLIGGAFTAVFWLRKHKQPLWALADCLAPGLALGQMFGRIGCYFNGCCYGQVSPAHGVIFPAIGDNLPHLPTQLYEAGFVLVLAAFLFWFKKRRSYVGQVFWIYLGAYSIGRFILEIYRGDVERGTLISNALSPAQWISILGLISALVFHLRMRKS